MYLFSDEYWFLNDLQIISLQFFLIQIFHGVPTLLETADFSQICHYFSGLNESHQEANNAPWLRQTIAIENRKL